MTVYLGTLMICLISLVLGAAVCCPSGGWSWLAPPVGLAAAMLISLSAMALPGEGTTAAAAVGVALVISAVVLWRQRVAPDFASGGPLAEGLPIAAMVLAFCSLPFLANGRIGVLGVSMLDDLSFHMGQADAMRTLGLDAHVTSSGYPLGPHALVAALAEGTGIGVGDGFTALLLSIPVLTALTALTVLDRGNPVLRSLGAVVCGTPYLVSAYVAEGAFKEPLLALFFLAFILGLRDVHRSRRLDPRRGAVLVLTGGGGAAAFGIAALIWPALGVAILGSIELFDRRRERVRRKAVVARVVLGAGLLAAAVFALSLRSREFFDSGPGQFVATKGTGGNYAGQLNPFEALGIWPYSDFRYGVAHNLVLGPVVLVAVAVVLGGVMWCRRHRESALLAGAIAAVTVYLVARPVTLAYFSGKALVVAAPILTLTGVMAGLAAASGLNSGRRRVVTGGLIMYLALAGYSSALALRASHVRPSGPGPDLAAFRTIVQGARTLYLGRDNFAAWDLRGAKLFGYQGYSTGLIERLTERPAKSRTDRTRAAVDIDSVGYRRLNAFRYVVTPRTAFASSLPVNYRLLRSTPWHLLWERRGLVQQRLILDEGEAPGAVLDCERGNRRGTGSAFVRPRPVTGPVGGWRTPGGGRPPAPGVTSSGGSLVQRLRLGAGIWDLSMRYLSDVPLQLRAGTLVRSLEPNIEDDSSFFTAGHITRTRGGSVTVEVAVPERRRIDIERTVVLGTVVATRVDRPGRVVPLRTACGRYVDWFDPGR